MLDINQIRDELNELPFRSGEREVFLGRISDLFEGESEEAIAERLRQWEQELQRHTLRLSRPDDDSDSLFVVQELRSLAPDVSWIAEGFKWASKITTAVLEMVVLGLIGVWLDNQLDTRFLAVLGFAVGVPLGIWHLITMTKRKRNDGRGD